MTFPTNNQQAPRCTPGRPPIPSGFDGLTLINGDLWVTNDYYKYGGIRLPLDLPGAQDLVSMNPGWDLPTPAQVDQIWGASEVTLPPVTIPWAEANVTMPVFRQHHDMIEKQLEGFERSHDFPLIAGHKKDLVLGSKPGRVAIYGWHQPNGYPIQPLSNIHGATYKDYSHGVRLVYKVT